MLRRAALIFLSFALASPALFADVTMKTFTRGSGYRGTGGSEATVTRLVQGNKAKEDSQFQMTGKLMKFMTGGERGGTHIIRVDQDKIWRIFIKKRTYTETSISGMIKKREEQRKTQPDPTTGAPPGPEEKPTHRIKKSELSIEKTGEKKTISGFPSEKTQANMRVEVEEIATKEVTTYIMRTGIWLTPMVGDLKTALDEEMKFQKAYMAKMGLSVSPKDSEVFGGAALAFMLGVGDKKTQDLLKQLKDKTKNLEGFPMATESEWTVLEDPKAVARREQAKAEADKAEDNSPDLSGDPKDMVGNLMGSFAKKKIKQNQEAKAKAQEGKPVFSTYHEVQAISTVKVKSSEFEIPAGFRREE